jgi:hypothetical protein
VLTAKHMLSGKHIERFLLYELPKPAGVPVGQMMTILTEFGVESRIEEHDYLQGLAALRKVW